ncbi:MAG TPA: TonB-dependent receptor plug domain-containing protein, partial [Fibrobacteria bacterium]|nr:TonB-dependent receptor plug domain-containing protein [Fibrobacteria bacterium]
MSIPIPATPVPLKAGLLAAFATLVAATAVRAEDTAAAEGTISTLPPLEVRGHGEAPGKTQDATALKLGMSLRETPRGLTVMNAERLGEQNFTKANETFNYTPGVFANSYGQGGYHFYSRGQRMAAVDNRVDGFAGIAAGGDFSPSLFGIERTVMLRGPASLQYGSAGAPGGMINLISKKPQAVRSTEFNLSIGPYGGSDIGFNDGSSYGAEIDATGPLSDDGRVLYRAQGRFENERHFTADVKDRNQYLDLALTYNLDNEGRFQLTPMLRTTRHWRPAGRASVLSPTSSLAARGNSSSGINFEDLSSIDVNLSAGGRLDETFMAGGDFRARPLDAVLVTAAYRYLTYDTDVNQWAPTGNPSRNTQGDWVISRAQTKSINERFNHGFDANASYDFKPANSAAWKNFSQVGFNARITGSDRSA